MKRKSWLKYTLLNNIRSQIKLNSFCRKWEKMNPENDTIPKNCFPIENVKVGKYTYGELNVITFSNNTTLKIGNYVSIAQNVVFLLDVEHFIHHISTYPFRVKVVQDCECEAFSKGDIIVEDDVWIGYGAKIMSGVRIGQGSVIAAAAVVTRDVPPYTIVGGIPAKVIKQRFDSNICEKLSNTDFSRIRDKDIKNNLTELYTTVSINNVECLLAKLPTKL